MDKSILQYRDCRILFILLYPETAMDVAHLYSISLLFLAGGGNTRTCGVIGRT